MTGTWIEVRGQLNLILDQLDHTISSIRESPKTWPGYHHGTQRYVFLHFPFQIIYRRRGAFVEIIAVAHGRRRPGYWAEKL